MQNFKTLNLKLNNKRHFYHKILGKLERSEKLPVPDGLEMINSKDLLKH